MPDLLEGPSAGVGEYGPDPEHDARRQAIGQIERRRRFHVHMAVSVLMMVLLVVIWATSEYHNAGGWPSQGFSQSSGLHDVWNYWIVYPVGAILVLVGGRAWFVYGHKPISEDEITGEMLRQQGRR
jgi:hypothetical protein